MPAPPTPQDLLAARRALVRADPALAELDASVAPFAWRTRQGGFAGVVRMILGQQVSVVSADATWARLVERAGEVTPEAMAALDDADFRLCGFSGQKTRYARAIAAAERDGAIAFARLPELSDEAALEALTALHGVGRWTAEIYLMMAEGRLDAFPAGDIAVQEAVRWLDALPERPSAEAITVRAERWRPHRAVAVHLLWEWYMAVKSGARAHPLDGTTVAPRRAGVGA